MTAEAAIRAALRGAGHSDGIRSTKNLSGGCIHTVMRVDLDDGTTVAAKVNAASMRPIFEEEAEGLRALAANGAVLVPGPIGIADADGHTAFIMKWLEAGSAGPDTWARFGEELAELHLCDAGRRFGFATDNHLGSTPQPNAWCDDWVHFNAEHRLGHQLRLARDSGKLDAHESRRVQQVIDRLDRLIPSRPHPALLHGDLWSGNAMCVQAPPGPRIAVIDPACSIGDGWADIAMMKLFDGFPATCFDAYRARVRGEDLIDARIAVYQLYHVLNHVNIFGRGYAAQAMALCETPV